MISVEILFVVLVALLVFAIAALIFLKFGKEIINFMKNESYRNEVIKCFINKVFNKPCR